MVMQHKIALVRLSHLNDGKIMAVGAPADEGGSSIMLAVSKFLNTKITNGHNSVIK